MSKSVTLHWSSMYVKFDISSTLTETNHNGYRGLSVLFCFFIRRNVSSNPVMRKKRHFHKCSNIKWKCVFPKSGILFCMYQRKVDIGMLECEEEFIRMEEKKVPSHSLVRTTKLKMQNTFSSLSSFSSSFFAAKASKIIRPFYELWNFKKMFNPN